ncbi:unnamed protein product, partial [Rotaria sp. Silwood2]
MSNRTAYFYVKKRQERREKKNNQQHKRRSEQKRKRSLISLFSTSSISSDCIDKSSIFDENSNAQQPKSNQNDNFTYDPLPALTNISDDKNLNLSNDDIMLFDVSSSSSSSSSPSSPSSSSSSSDTDSSEDESDTMYMYSDLPDNRPLYPSTSTTVSEFSRDILEFCRVSRLPSKQRSYLLDLFRKYLPAPNLVPTSGDDLLDVIGIGEMYRSEKLCGACYSSTADSICSTIQCIHEEMK